MYKRYFEIPYLLNGRGFDGADCYGLILLWYKNELGIALIDPINDLKHFNDADERDLFMSNIGSEWIALGKTEQPRRHDVALLRNGSVNPNHVAVFIDPENMLQTLEGPGCHIAKFAKWRPRTFRIYRHKRLAE